MKSSKIRQKFLDYFKERQHEVVGSSSLIPVNDPSLLFTNAGMVQFKEAFLGLESRDYNRAVSSQRCVRAGGKHNDLENVGYTARHHTFFEMLGNFSFGDYFKRQAIVFSWDFLTKVLDLPEEKLWVTVFTDDDEAADIWLNELKVSEARFSRCGAKDNFWSMGDTGPCGPCTEIFYDHGPKIPGGPPGSIDEDGDRYIEIWNLVFMQYNRDASGKLAPLPKPSVDTGMGLERIAAVVQGVHSNYDIDLFQHLIDAICENHNAIDRKHPSVNVIADHIRSCSFLIIDGVVPSNEGRGYVLRRIIRRAIRHGSKLGLDEGFFHRLVGALGHVMGDAYPELIDKKAIIERVLAQEEGQFARTLDNGLRLLTDAIGQLESDTISGKTAFNLYDTYGFPLDLTADIAREHNLLVDVQEFEHLMQQQRAKSKGSSQFEVDYTSSVKLEQKSHFVGYDNNEQNAKVTMILSGNESVESADCGDNVSIILDDTPFYAQSGGQVGDSGEIVSKDAIFKVTDTQKLADAIVHIGQVTKGRLQKNETISAKIDVKRRDAIRLNHSATHLLHAALKQVLGAHVQQKGSLVDAARARFDFSHFEALSKSQLQEIESLVNEQIRQNNRITTEVMHPDKAKKEGALALFGEKYGDNVRVLTMGAFSKELCGGTHALRTGDIGLFKIVSEGAIAAGIRRIEMVTGEYALAYVNQQIDLLGQSCALIKADKSKMLDKLSQILQDNKQLEKQTQRLKAQLATDFGEQLLKHVKQVADIKVLAEKLEGVDANELRKTLDTLKSKLDKAVIVLVAVNGEKMNVVAGISKSLIGKAPSAKLLVQHLCGRGGGREDMAQGGGRVTADLDAKLISIVDLVANHGQ
jgi:alanyl-tRNA synthetase